MNPHTMELVAAISAAITLLINLFRLPAFGVILEKIPSRLRLAIPVLLGVISGILSSVLGGMPWFDAIFIGLFSGPGAVFLHEFVFKSVLGKSATAEQLKQAREDIEQLVKAMRGLAKTK